MLDDATLVGIGAPILDDACVAVMSLCPIAHGSSLRIALGTMKRLAGWTRPEVQVAVVSESDCGKRLSAPMAVASDELKYCGEQREENRVAARQQCFDARSAHLYILDALATSVKSTSSGTAVVAVAARWRLPSQHR